MRSGEAGPAAPLHSSATATMLRPLAQGRGHAGTTFHIASPEGYELPGAIIDQAMRVAQHGAKIRVFRDPCEAVRSADAVYTDVWTSMDRKQRAPREQAFAAVSGHAEPDAVCGRPAAFLHACGSDNEEVATEVFESLRRWCSIRPRTPCTARKRCC